MHPKIQLSGVYKSFGHKKVLDGIDLTIEQGESLVVIGGSGSGKSVLIKSILGIVTPDKGSIRIDGEEVTRLSFRERQPILAKFGMLFQGGALFDSLPVWENITFALLRNDRIEKPAARELAVATLKAVGLGADVANLFPVELSGGMQKRVRSVWRLPAPSPPGRKLFFSMNPRPASIPSWATLSTN
jgi:phospholipid/cholesterol/gamma-HCH transport system ATP-binding protein